MPALLPLAVAACAVVLPALRPGHGEPSTEPFNAGHTSVTGQQTNAEHMRFGRSVLTLMDRDADGVPEFAVGAPAATVGTTEGAGCVFVYSGKSRTLLERWVPRADAVTGFGRLLARTNDMNDDGVADVVVGSYSVRLEVRCGRTGTVVGERSDQSLPAPGEEPDPTYAALLEQHSPSAGPVSAPDLDGDGEADVLQFDSRMGAHVTAVSGASGEELWQEHWVDCGPRSGLCIAPFHDVDGDGAVDLLVGTSHRVTLGVPTPPAPGNVRLLSGATGEPIWIMKEEGRAKLEAFLEEMTWQHRLLVVAGPRKDVEAQVQALAKAFDGVLDRDIVVVELTGGTATDRIGTMRTRPPSHLVAEHYALTTDSFQMVLVGKDSGVKERYREVTSAETIWSVIDVMPMRRSERRSRDSAAEPGERRGPPHAFYAFRNGLSAGSPDENAALARALGYAGIGSVEGRLVKAYAAACKEAGIRLFSTYVGGEVTGEGFTYGADVDEAIAVLAGSDALVELYVRAGENASDSQAITFVREIAAKAAKANLRVVLYPHTNFHVDTVADAVRIAEATECANVGVAFNLCHFLKVEPGADLRATLKLAAQRLWSVSTSGADADGTNWKALIRPLDEGKFDQKSLLRALREVGYRGPVGLQCFGIKLDSKESLRRSIEAWRDL